MRNCLSYLEAWSLKNILIRRYSRITRLKYLVKVVPLGKTIMSEFLQDKMTIFLCIKNFPGCADRTARFLSSNLVLKMTD